MKKQTKNILTKLALVAAPFAVAATITTSAISANADSGDTIGNWDMTPAEKASAAAEDKLAQEHMEANGTIGKKSDEEWAANQKAIDAKYAAQDARNEKEFHYSLTPAKKSASTTTTTTKKVVKKHVAKKTTKKKAVKKHARKHARRLFRIRVKAHRIYAYKTSNFRHHKGRRAERKGTKLYVYGIMKKGHKTYYKVYSGRFITSSRHYITRVAR